MRIPIILIVDDEVISALALKNKLIKKGFEVYFATTYLDAIDLSKKHKPDIVLVDINLNDEKTGIDFVRSTGPYEKAIFISGYKQELYEEELVNVQFDYFIEKPVNFAKVNELINIESQD